MNKPENKKYIWYDVKLECMLPATLIYRVYSEDNKPELAIDLAKRQMPNSVKYRILEKKDIKYYVYLAGTSLLKYILRK
jgi:hypothetical protein